MEKKLLRRRMILVNYSLAALAAFFCVWIFSLQAIWFIPLALLFSPWKDERNNVLSILGGVNYFGSVYSLVPLFQWAQDSAYGFIGLSFYQRAKQSANIVVGVSIYQRAKLSCLTFGVSLFQAGVETTVFFGLSVYQKAKDFASMLFGFTCVQSSGIGSMLVLGVSLVQLSKGDSNIGAGVSIVQDSKHSILIVGLSFFQIGYMSEILVGASLYQKSQNLSFFGLGASAFQLSTDQSEIGWGINLYQRSADSGNVGIRFGLSFYQRADKIATGVSLSLLRSGKIHGGVEAFDEIMNNQKEICGYW